MSGRYPLFISLLVSLSFSALAQEEVVRSDSSVTKDGESFFVHRVASKQTLYAISKAYGVQMSQLAFANPGIMDGIQPGQYILIPKDPKASAANTGGTTEPLRSDGRHLLYTVPPKMTLYSIAKEHGVAVTDLVELNPELKDGLKQGMVIRIPVKRMTDVSGKDGVALDGSPAQPSVADQQALSAGSSSLKPVMAAPGALSDSVHIALLLPLQLEENDTLREKWWPGLEPQISKRSLPAVEFLEGALMAIDSLAGQGMRLSLKVFDTERSPSVIEHLFNNGSLNGVDLIIGPLFSDEFKVAAAKALEKNIAIVSPTVQGKDVAKDNGLVVKGMTSHDRLTVELGRYMAGIDTIRAGFIIHYGRTEDQYLMWRFKQGTDAVARTKPFTLPQVNLAKSTRDSLKSVLSRTEVNHLVMLTNDQARVASLLREMHRWYEDYRIVMYVPDTWLQFKNVDMYYLDKMRCTYASNDFVDRNRAGVKRLMELCAQRYSTEPSDLTYRGFDLMMHLAPQARRIRAEGTKALDGVSWRGIQQEFRWAQLPNGGMENTDAHVVRFNDMRLVKVD
jgi:LysM repeat protein